VYAEAGQLEPKNEHFLKKIKKTIDLEMAS
jgi:hypothetical protein